MAERWIPAIAGMTTLPCLSMETQKRRPVGGEDRAPACQKRLGESGPAGETGPVKRAWRPLRFWSLKVGIARHGQNAIRACVPGKNACAKTELFRLKTTPRGGLPQFPR